MHGYRAYHQQKQTLPLRIDLILALYRRAIEFLDRADASLREPNVEAARALLTKTQLIVSAMGAGLVGDTDDAANNFRRLYEFVSFKLTSGTLDDIAAARRILATLLDAFDTVRGQAILLESEGKIPTLDNAHQVCLST